MRRVAFAVLGAIHLAVAVGVAVLCSQFIAWLFAFRPQLVVVLTWGVWGVAIVAALGSAYVHTLVDGEL
jgi:hypothetical protein